MPDNKDKSKKYLWRKAVLQGRIFHWGNLIWYSTSSAADKTTGCICTRCRLLYSVQLNVQPYFSTSAEKNNIFRMWPWPWTFMNTAFKNDLEYSWSSWTSMPYLKGHLVQKLLFRHTHLHTHTHTPYRLLYLTTKINGENLKLTIARQLLTFSCRRRR